MIMEWQNIIKIIIKQHNNKNMEIIGQIVRWVLSAIGIFFLIGCVISIYMNSDENYWRDVLEGLATCVVIMMIAFFIKSL